MPKRNDPCPCGSGKKYKNCCLLREMQERADRRRDTPSPHVREEPPETVPSPEPDPLTERINAWWETFTSAAYEEQLQLVREALRKEPELIDGEMIFEIGNTLFAQAVEHDEIERFGRLLDSLEETAPQAVEEERAYVLQWRFESALLREDWPAVEEAFLAFSQRAGQELDLYYELINALAYHGRLDVLLQGMRQALPHVDEADGLMPGAAGRFAEKLADYELLQRLGQSPDLTADDPQFLQRLSTYGLKIGPRELGEILDYRSGRAQPAWSAADFHLSPARDFDEDPAKQNLNLLLLAWTHYAHAEEGVPQTKAELVRKPLYRYFVRRSEGKLNDGAGSGRGRRRRRAADRGQPALIPDRGTLDRFLGEMLGFLSLRYYEAIALFELIPVWLRFLKQHGLLDEAREETVLQDLQALHGDVLQIAEKQVNDPRPAENLRAWPLGGE